MSAYIPPGKQLLTSDLNIISDLDNLPFILAGDLNAKHRMWLSRTSNKKGKILYKFAIDHHLNVIGPEEPTYFSPAGHRPDILDIAVLRDINCNVGVTSVNDLTSDHNPIVIDLDLTGTLLLPTSKTKTDWDKYTDILSTDFDTIKTIDTTDDLDAAVEELTDKIKAAIAKASRPSNSHVGTRPNLPPDILKLISDRRTAKRQWQRTLDPTDKQLYNRLTTKIRDKTRDVKNENWRNLLCEADDSDSVLWRVSKALRNRRNASSVIHGTSGLAYSAAEKAEALAQHLESQFSPNFDKIDLDFIDTVDELVEQDLHGPPIIHNIFVTPQQVHDLVSKCKPKKAPGPDLIPPTALKALPMKPIVALTNIINAIFRLQYYPTAWKQAIVVAIPKPGKDAKFPQNYRPISLLNSLNKIVERVILNYLESFTSDKHILPNEQYGFRQKHSTTQQLTRVVEYITEGFNYKMYTGAVFLDVAKAFDKVWHNGLLVKLIKFGYPLFLIKILHSYLDNRHFQVKFLNSLSPKYPISAGVPQGSVLSPLLYNIYASDIPVPLNSTTYAQYADDTAVLHRSRHVNIIQLRLQKALDDLEEWCTKWRININPAKSTAILFSKRRDTPSGQLQLFNVNIPWHRKAKYLGVTMDCRLTFHDHIKDATDKAKTSFGRLLPLLHKTNGLTLNNKLRLYKTIIRPQLTYASSAWYYVARQTKTKLQTLQNKVLRHITNATPYVRNERIHKDLCMQTIDEYIKSTNSRFFDKLTTHPNSTFRALGDYDTTTNTKYKRPMQADVA